MRVVMTVATLAPEMGGPTVAVLKLAEALGRRSCQVAVAARVAGTARDLLRTLDIDPGLEVVDLGSAPWRRLRHEIRRRGARIVHDHGIWHPANVASALAARLEGLPWIAQPRGMLEPWSLQHHRWRKRVAWHAYQARLLRGAAAVVATSDDEQRSIAACLPAARVRVVANGVDWPSDLPPADARPRQALFLSRIHPKKQPELLVELWSELRPAGWKLVIAGPGDPEHLASLRRCIERCGAPGVELRDAVYGPGKARLFAESGLFLLPTMSENFGNAIAEAMAHGVPVLTTTATPWPQLASLGLGWWVAPQRDALRQALAAALAEDPAALAERGRRSRAWVRSFSWPAAAERLEAVYAEAGAARS